MCVKACAGKEPIRKETDQKEFSEMCVFRRLLQHVRGRHRHVDHLLVSDENLCPLAVERNMTIAYRNLKRRHVFFIFDWKHDDRKEVERIQSIIVKAVC